MKEVTQGVMSKNGRNMKMKAINFGKSLLLKYRLLSNFLLIFLSVAVVTFYSLPASVAQEKQEQQDVSKEVEKYKEMKLPAASGRGIW
jgi:cell division protein FtsB